MSAQTPIVRYLDLPERVRPFHVELPLRVLVMVSSPPGYPTLDVEDEWRKLNSALSALIEAGMVELTRLEYASLACLLRTIRKNPYHVFHFIGHGGFSNEIQDGQLILEDDKGRGVAISGSYLGTVLHDHRPLRLVVLNACDGARNGRTDLFSGAAQSLVQQGIPAVIAMQFEITDEAAITFAHEFYLAVAEGLAIDASLAEARRAIFARGNDVEWGTPVLFMRTPDGQLFDIKKLGPVERQQRLETLRRKREEAEQQRQVALREQEELAAKQARQAEMQTQRAKEAELHRLAFLREQQELASEQARQAKIKKRKDEEAEQQQREALREQQELAAQQARQAEEQKRKGAEAEQERLVVLREQQAQAAEQARQAEIQKRKDEEVEQQRLEALGKQQEQAAEQVRLVERKKRKDEEAEQQRLESLRKQQELAAEQARQAEIQKRSDDEAEQQQLAALRKQQELAAEQSRLAEENRKEAEAEQLRFVALREQQELAAEQARQADIQRLKDEAEAGQQRMTALRKKEIAELKKNRAILIALGIFCAIFLFGILAIIVKPGEPEPSAGSDAATAANAAAATAVEAAKEAAATPRTDTDKAIDILDKVIKANK